MQLCRFPAEEFIIGEVRESVWSLLWPRFDDVGAGSCPEAKVFAEFQYRGDGLFTVVETLHNPTHFDRAMDSYKPAKLVYEERRARPTKRLAEREPKTRAVILGD